MQQLQATKANEEKMLDVLIVQSTLKFIERTVAYEVVLLHSSVKKKLLRTYEVLKNT